MNSNKKGEEKVVSQKCPKCASNRIRRGYRATPLLLRFFFYYNLLCDNCNWEFRGFAAPFLKKRRKKINNQAKSTV